MYPCTTRIAAGLAAACATGLVTVASLAASASAQVADVDGPASMGSPYVPGVPHVPAGVLLAIDPDAGASFIGPKDSVFNGPFDDVSARIDAWWAEQMAHGVTPADADVKLIHLRG